jgi:sigma-B regulation protein RsbQ
MCPFRNNVQIRGRGERAMMFAHGFGCDQNMWRFVAPAFEADFATVLFDHVGAGHSDLTAYDRGKYSTLSGYADDVVEIGRSLRVKDAVFVGHSVSAMIGVLAAIKDPTLFESVVLVGPSARYIDDGDYVGGFSAHQIEVLLSFSGREPHGLVGADGARHHGQPGPSRTGRGTYE